MNDIFKNKRLSFAYAMTFFLTLLPYIIIPYLALFFINNSKLTNAQVGFIIGIAALSTSVSALFTSKIEKKVGEKKLLISSTIMIGFSYLLYALVNNFYLLVAVSLLLGTASGINGTLMKCLVAEEKGDISSDKAFRIRYMIFCVSIIIGPFLSQIFGLFISEKLILILLGLAYLLLSISFTLFQFSSRNSIIDDKLLSKIPKAFDYKPLVYISIIGILSFIVFSIFESVTPLAISNLFENPATIYANLLILNSVLALVIQPLIILVSKKINTKNIAIVGALLFASSYLLFSISNTIFMIIISTIVFTMGEVLLIPSLDVLVDTAAGDDNKKLYFSITEVKQIGFFIGPWMAGIILDRSSSMVMYLIFTTVSICLAVVLVYYKKQALKNKSSFSK